jgi:GH24 family phage-related lysozyme (muramidase)
MRPQTALPVAPIVKGLHNALERATDRLIEGAELALNRYAAAKPDSYGEVIVLRDSTASYTDLKDTLIGLARRQRVIDLFILTHGGADFISVAGGIDSKKIVQMMTDNGGPLPLRSVYMMNCVGSSLNRAWLSAGAKTSSGTKGNNYLPEPTMFFFWQNWRAGKSFGDSVVTAYHQTISFMNDTVRGLLQALPGGSALASLIDLSTMDFVLQSAPDVAGASSATISSDDLSKVLSVSNNLALSVVPAQWLRMLSVARAMDTVNKGALSNDGLAFIKRFEGFKPNLYEDAGNCAIGYGTRVHDGSCDGRASEKPYAKGISEADASALLVRDTAAAAKSVADAVKVTLNQNQTDALISFTYNVGVGAFADSTLLKLLNQGKYDSVPNELKRWTKARQGDKIVELPGLIERRAAEAELFQRAPATAQSLSTLPVMRSYEYHCAPSPLAAQTSLANAMVLPVVAGVTVAEAAQIGLGAISVAQAQAGLVEGGFSLSYDRAQRLLEPEARLAMPNARIATRKYAETLFSIGMLPDEAPPELVKFMGDPVKAVINIFWEGNDYGEIGTLEMRRDLEKSTDFSKSTCQLSITRVSRIPDAGLDPRTWPINFGYEGVFDPVFNGHWEFSGEFLINAFGILTFVRHQVVSRSAVEWGLDKPEKYVRKGADRPGVKVNPLPADQVEYLKQHSPHG